MKRFFSLLPLLLLLAGCHEQEPERAPAAAAPPVQAPAFVFPRSNDSLLLLYRNTAAPDSIRLEALNSVAFNLRKTDPDSGLALSNLLITEARNRKIRKWEAFGFNARASNYFNKSDYPKALADHQEALRLRRESGDKKAEAQSLGNIGLTYEKMADYVHAIDFHLQSLAIKEDIGDSAGMANSFGNIANLYMALGDYPQAMKYMVSCRDIKARSHDLSMLALVTNNIANIYEGMNEHGKALDNYRHALRLYDSLSDAKGASMTLNNIGLVLLRLNRNADALDTFQRCLAIRTGLGDRYGIANCMSNLGLAYYKTGDLQQAEYYSQQSLEIAQEIGSPYLSNDALQTLSDISERKHDDRNAYRYFKAYVKMRDSLNNVENDKAMARKEAGFEFRKKSEADSIRNAEAQKVNEANLAAEKLKVSQGRMVRNFLIGGLALILLFAFFLWNRFQLTRKQKSIIEQKKTEIEQQKNLVEEKQKEIIDSINYAKRLQEAILPPQELFDRHFREWFLFYQPKDIVAGDFYFLESNGPLVFVAAADCTGHGVPGALVSVVCSNALHRSVKEFGLREPGEVLDKVTALILETFSKSGNQVKDGMDISLCCFDLQAKTLRWAGAHNPLWIARGGEMLTLDADHQPVGLHEFARKFTTHQLPLEAGDMLYLFSDGYADQFGGEKGKKLKTANLRKLLLASASLPAAEQRALLDRHFHSWRGPLDQVDDVLVIGIRV